MVFNNVIVYCILLLSAKIVLSNEVKKKPLKDEDVKDTFVKLLKTIVKVNEERMQAMEKITRLQDYMLTKNKLKNYDDTYESMEEEDNRIVLAFADLPLLRRTEGQSITRALCNRFNLERKYINLSSRQFLKLACHSNSTALCVSACKKSVVKLCEKFHCNHNSMRDFKTDCHKHCGNMFELDE